MSYAEIEHEGWKNSVTWCVWLWLNNDKHTHAQALRACLLGSLVQLVVQNMDTVREMAPWAWVDGNLTYVDWRAIDAALWLKVKETL